MPRKYQLSDYSYSFSSDSKISDFTTKNRRQRVIFGGKETIFNVSEILSASAFADFEQWVNVTLNNGADSFTGEYWDSDIEKTGLLSIVDGSYQFEYLSSDVYKVSYQLQLDDRSLDDGENIHGLIAGGVDFDTEYFNLFETLINFNNFRT